MSIWTRPLDIESINNGNKNTAVESLGIEFTEIGDDYIKTIKGVGYKFGR